MSNPIYAPDAMHPSLRDTFSSLAVASISSMIKDKSGKIAGYAEAMYAILQCSYAVKNTCHVYIVKACEKGLRQA